MGDFDVFDFHRIFLGDAPLGFLLEIVFRTVIMYTYTLILLRILGKRGMGQLSALEVSIIISFGSAIGDPMMGKDVPILHGMVAVTTIALLQIGLESVINKNNKLEVIMEGKADCLVDNGLIMLEAIKENNLSHADLFRFLRLNEVEHLGQVKKAFFETSGTMSVLFLSPKKAKPGLSIIPDNLIPQEVFNDASYKSELGGDFSCTNCGFTYAVEPNTKLKQCVRCSCREWVTAHEAAV